MMGFFSQNIFYVPPFVWFLQDMVVVPLDNSSSSTDEDAGENSEHASLDDTRDTQSKVLWRHSPDDGEPSDAEDTELLSARASSKTTLIEEVS